MNEGEYKNPIESIIFKRARIVIMPINDVYVSYFMCIRNMISLQQHKFTHSESQGEWAR